MKHSSARKSLAIPQNRWLAYAAAGLATASGSAPAAEAEIHYSGHVHVRLTGLETLSKAKLPLSGTAVLAFRRSTYSGHEIDKMAVTGGKGHGDTFVGSVRVLYHGAYYASKLAARQPISRGSFINFYGALVGFSGFGPFATQGIGFAGFQFDIGRGTQYGWVRVKTIGNGDDNKIVIEDYAWADPGEKIKAGQTTSSPKMTATVPASGSLGLLALGASGLVAWRRSRNRD